MVPSLVEDGYIDHFEVYEEILSPQFIRKHYSFVEAVAAAGRNDFCGVAVANCSTFPLPTSLRRW